MSILGLLDEKSVFITGATRGIGRAIALECARHGATVHVNGRDPERTEAAVAALVGELGGDAAVVASPCDITDGEAVKAALMAAYKHAGRLDVVINNAGIMEPAVLGMSRDDSLRRMLAVNVEAAFGVARIAARLMMRQKRGSIINMSSIIGRVGVPGHSAYAASKAAVIGMTVALAKELAPANIRVNALAPGFIETDLTAGIEGDARETVLGQIAMGRSGRPEDVAGAALFFASDLSAYVSGQVLGVDGVMVT